MNKKQSGKFFPLKLQRLKSFGRKSGAYLRKNKKYILIGLLSIVVLHMVILVVFIIAINQGAFGPLPDRSQLREIENPLAAEIYTADSVMMGRYFLQNRLDMKESEVTDEIINALVATEDERFYEHHGIDFKSLGRVLVKSIMLQKEGSGGGSTITQQLAKNLYPRRNYPFASIVINKLREMVIAVKLEKLYSKKEILILYLNTVPFGEETYGLKSGALRYFKKSPRQLKPEEIAMMVGMLKGTSLYNPRTNYGLALQRRNVVLLQMERYGMITESEKDSLSNLEIKLDYYKAPVYTGVAPYFRAQVQPHIQQILEDINKQRGTDYDLYTDGLKIYTTIDSRLQSFAESAVNNHLSEYQSKMDEQWRNARWQEDEQLSQVLQLYLTDVDPDSIETKRKSKIFDWKEGAVDTMITPLELAIYNMKLLQAGFVAMDVHQGDILAWVGGVEHELFEYDHATAPRQVGSTFKPFLYLAALENGYDPCDFFNNDRYIYAQFDNWSPRNSDRSYEGMYSLKGALTYSINTVSARLISEIGVNRVVDIARRAGITSDFNEVPSIALGSAELSLFEMVKAYQTIANMGEKVTPKYVRKIVDTNDEIIYTAPDGKMEDYRPLASSMNIEVLIEMMKNVVNRGTASRLRYKYNINTEIAGKTGTSQDQADGWFIGFTPDIIAGTWVGAEYPVVHFKNRSGQGAYSALPIFAGFFKQLLADNRYDHLKNSSFPISDTVSKMLRCSDYIEPPDLEPIDTQEVEEIESF